MAGQSTTPAAIKLSDVFSPEELAALNRRSDVKGWRQLLAHLGILVGSGLLWHGAWTQGMLWGWLALPLYGFSLATMFAAVHECVHRTAFATPWLNDAVAWVAGVLSFYNSAFYRRYHQWHHRYTQIPGKDPELEDPVPTNWRMYLWQLSGIPWWWGKVRGHLRVLLGNFQGCPYIAPEAQATVRRSTAAQLAVYALAIALSVWAGQPWFLMDWVVPLAVGQPFLRFILLAEHTGCSYDSNPLTNTRTTLTGWPVRLLMWNMPFHAEHHFCPAIPFHALPQAHQKLRDKWVHLAPGYIAANREIVAQFPG
ncbi:MAG: fatty acid desaturase family protein [Gloeomargarita sp. SKYG116]|nr:fatty acid desaturase family protein [Gloeomargarita sp. SKYG116]MDW8400912.1 fatty acid desaturase family protein [Gloeomargarita sp. SKYGB_i_bin116]